MPHQPLSLISRTMEIIKASETAGAVNKTIRPPFPRHAHTLLWIFAVIVVLGFADAAYLTASHYLSLPLPCGASQGCDIVTKSSWSEFMGIPVALFGALYYCFLLIITIFALDTHSVKAARLASYITIIGLISSAYFMIVQFFVIGAICLYCTASAIFCLTLFILSFPIQIGR